MTIEKINFSYPKGTLQSVFDTEEMTALELASKTSKKVDECVDLVNGVEQSAIEATAIVDEMKVAQEQFVAENNDIRTTLLTENQTYIDGLNTSKTAFDSNMTSAINTVVSNAGTTIHTDIDTKIDELVTDGTIATILNGQVEAVETSLTNHINTDDGTLVKKGHVQLQSIIDGSENKALTPKGLKNHVDDYSNPHILNVPITFYVNGATGIDTNDGLTPQTPLKTIQKAVDKVPYVTKGNIIIDITGGTYNEAVMLKYLGVGTVTFNGKKDASNNPLVILDGIGLGALKSGITASFCNTTVYINDIKAQNYTLGGFDNAYGVYMALENCRTFACGSAGFRNYHCVGSANNCVFDANHLTSAYCAIGYDAYLSITNCELKNSALYAAYYANQANGHFDNNNVHDNFCGLACRMGGYPNSLGCIFTACGTGVYLQLGGGWQYDKISTTFVSCTKNIDITTDPVNIYGRWDSNPLIVGDNRIFIDNGYRLRIKTSSDPTSDTDGNIIMQLISGTTANRPTANLVPGQQYFDITLNKPIWRNAANSGWVDSAGVVV